MKKRNKRIGSSLDEFLREERVLEEARAAVLKETWRGKFSKRWRRKTLAR